MQRFLRHLIARLAINVLNSFSRVFYRPAPHPPVLWAQYQGPGAAIRIMELIPRLAPFIDAKPHHTSRLEARYTKPAWLGLLRYFWYRDVLEPHRLGFKYRDHKLLFCNSGYLHQIVLFPGPVLVDYFDPIFTADNIALLNKENVVAVVATTEPMRDRLLTHGLQKPCHVIPSGIDLSLLNAEKSQSIHREMGTPPGTVVVGYTQKMFILDEDLDSEEHKDRQLYSISFLLKAMEIVWNTAPTVELWLIGTAQAKASDMLQQYPQIRNLGYIPHSALLNYVANFDIALYPRLHDFGGRHSVKLLEFMGCGCPIVTTDVTESFYVRDANCGLIATQTPTAFADKVLKLVNDSDLRTKLGENGARFAQNYQWRTLAQRYRAEVLQPILETVDAEHPLPNQKFEENHL